MKRILMNYLVMIGFAIALAGCNKSAEMTAEEKIAGESEKTWKAKRETNASGDVDRLTKDEKKEDITFWRNGNVKMTNGDQVMSGQWSLEGSNLKMQFTGSDVSENFTVLELEKDELKLQAGDGSQMTLKPD